jgi:hypothetical protein
VLDDDLGHRVLADGTLTDLTRSRQRGFLREAKWPESPQCFVPLSLYCCRLRVPGSWHSHGCSCPVRYLKEVAPLLGLVHARPIGPGVAFHLDCCLSRASQLPSSASILVGRKGARQGCSDWFVYEQQLTLPLSSSVQLLVASLHALSQQVDCGTIHGPSTLAVRIIEKQAKEKEGTKQTT